MGRLTTQPSPARPFALPAALSPPEVGSPDGMKLESPRRRPSLMAVLAAWLSGAHALDGARSGSSQGPTTPVAWHRCGDRDDARLRRHDRALAWSAYWRAWLCWKEVPAGLVQAVGFFLE